MKKYSEEEKEMWVEDWKQSGVSIWAYAKTNGLIGTTLQNWVKKPEKQSFVEIKPSNLEAMQYFQEILIEKKDIRIHLPVSIKANELRAVIEGLGCPL
jgi:transposase-like protein